MLLYLNGKALQEILVEKYFENFGYNGVWCKELRWREFYRMDRAGEEDGMCEEKVDEWEMEGKEGKEKSRS